MAEKLAVATLVTGPEWQPVAELTLPTLRRYADRLKADFITMDKRIHAHPHYDKWQLYDLLTQYDRIIYLDADIIVRQDCPDLFAQIPLEYVGGENELLAFPGQAEHLARFCERLGGPTLPCPFYLNGGMLVVSARHRQLFRPPEVMVTDLPWPEQNHLNARLIGEKYQVGLLPQAFNDRHRQDHYLHRSFILHYSCMSNQDRIDAISRDLAEWNRLFRCDHASVSAPSAKKSFPLQSSAPLAPGATVETARDYISPGFIQVFPDEAFPHMEKGSKSNCSWPHLRRQIPHIWYVDRRIPSVGFVSRDEAHILYNAALQFRGKNALEIGCWFGWSACHLALAGVRLDVIDPVLGRPDIFGSVADSLKMAGVLETVNLLAGSSPQTIHDLAKRALGPWSLFFIDGNHEAPHPLEDAKACAAHAAADALILFHDAVCPDVGQGLDYLRQQGWQTMVYHTMQMMGVAWRGKAQPVQHVPDPGIPWSLPSHLCRHPVADFGKCGHFTAAPVELCKKSNLLDAKAQAFFQDLVVKTNNFGGGTWLGHPICQNILDLWTIQETLSEVKPSLLVECGTNRGGSALFFAHLFDLLGHGTVVSVDVQKMHSLSHPRIEFIIGSSLDERILRHIQSTAEAAKGAVMVILDSDHAAKHVLSEMENYGKFVTPGSFMLVQDGVIDTLNLFRSARPGPLVAINEFLTKHPEFEVDAPRGERFLVTHHPNGWLRRIGQVNQCV